LKTFGTGVMSNILSNILSNPEMIKSVLPNF